MKSCVFFAFLLVTLACVKATLDCPPIDTSIAYAPKRLTVSYEFENIEDKQGAFSSTAAAVDAYPAVVDLQLTPCRKLGTGAILSCFYRVKSDALAADVVEPLSEALKQFQTENPAAFTGFCVQLDAMMVSTGESTMVTGA